MLYFNYRFLRELLKNVYKALKARIDLGKKKEKDHCYLAKAHLQKIDILNDDSIQVFYSKWLIILRLIIVIIMII